MRRDHQVTFRGSSWHPRQTSNAALAKSAKRGVPLSNRARVANRNQRLPFTPPEDWYEPSECGEYRFVIQDPGPGYRHVLTPTEVIARLADLPEHFRASLEVVQFSRMTRKKQSFP